MKDVEAEVGVKDIIGFYIKINDSARAKKDSGPVVGQG